MKISLLRFSIPCVFIGMVGLLLLSCDDRNEADLPRRPYSLAATYATSGVAVDVAARGNLVAIADNRNGAIVINTTNLSNIVVDYRRALRSPNTTCELVGLDEIHRMVLIGSDDPSTSFYFYSMDRDTFVIASGFGLPLRDIEVEPLEDTVRIWATDFNDGFVATQKVPTSDTTWTNDPNFAWQNWLPPSGEIRGFGRRADQVFAIACGEEGVYFMRAIPYDTLSSIEVPGIAYDCAWYGQNYVIVASQYHIVVLNASDPEAPSLVATLTISGADRLQEIVVQGEFAAVSDVNDGVYIVDLADPANPVYAQLLDVIDPAALDADPNGNRLHVADRGRGLLIFTK